jgi:hypothetical protein
VQQNLLHAHTRTGGASGCLAMATSCHGPRSELVIVSSMPAKYLLEGLQAHANERRNAPDELPQRRNLVASCLRLQLPMYITFDASEQHPLPSMPPGITAEDVFDAIPGLAMLLQTGNSPIEEFTAVRGSWEPHGGSGKLTQCELPERAARPA